MKSTNSPDFEILLLGFHEYIDNFVKGCRCSLVALELDISEIVVNGNLVIFWYGRRNLS